MKKSGFLFLSLVIVLIFSGCTGGSSDDSSNKTDMEMDDAQKAVIAQQEVDLEKGLSLILFSLERYFFDNDESYPENLGLIIENGYVSEFPTNPITSQPMRHVDFKAENYQGNFTYIPFDVDASGTFDGFYLIGYGHELSDGEDVDSDGTPDHVIVYLKKGAVEGTPDFSELLD